MAAESPAPARGHRPPRVFLSYSHDSPQHAARVLALARRLRRDGVNARIDQFDAFPPEGWPQWCAREILAARYVLLICTETYRRRFFGYEEAGVGRGVKWEGQILQNILYNDERNLRFIPVVFAKEDERFIPETVQGATRVRLSDCKQSDAGYKSLLRHFTGGKKLRPLPKVSRTVEPLRPSDASVPTEQVWDEATTIVVQKLDEIHAEQKDHERKSVERHQELLTVVTDPVVLRARLEEKIVESFELKRAELLGQKAPPAEIDALYSWRDRAKGQIAEGVAFITARAGDPNSPIIRKAAAMLEERGVDATLEFLDTTLKAERQRRKKEGRQLAEASLMKAGLHESRLERDEQERSLRDAIADAPDWWQPHNDLGAMLFRRAQWQLAEQAFEVARKFMPADEEATVLNNLAGVYQATNRLVEAEPLMKRVLKIDEESLTPEHLNVGIHLNNLAQLYQDTNRLSEAEPLMKRVISIFEKSYGTGHPDVTPSLSNLAQLYYATNRLVEAEPLMKRALKIDEESLAPDYRKVAIELDNLALLYQDTNRLAEAESLMERATSIFEKSFGPEHPSVGRNLGNRALLYQATNRLAEAEPLMKRALKIDERSFGPEHPNVAIRLNKLAQLYQATNRLAEAEPLMRKASVILLKSDRASGQQAPNLKLVLNNYACLLLDMPLPNAECIQRLAEAGREAGYTKEELVSFLVHS